jgi:hypothetical protein
MVRAPARRIAFGRTAQAARHDSDGRTCSLDRGDTMTKDRRGAEQLDQRLGAFLYADVGEDARGASVTVLSMLARLGVDPWREASALAGMPAGDAQGRLCGLLARFTDVPCLRPACADVASRLVAFLPREPVEDGSSAMAATPRIGTGAVWALGLLLAYTLYALLGHGA